MDVIYVAQRPSIKMDEGESTRLLGSSIVLGKDSYSKGSNWTMEKPSGELSSGKFFQWAIGTGWRTNWIRVESFLRIHSISRISAEGVEKLRCSGNLRISPWSYDMAGHAKKCVERYCELANKTTQQLYKVSTPCIDDHQFKEERLKSVGELSHVCSQIVLKCLYLARIRRPDILWSVNKLARSITKWTKACDKRLNRLISYIHHKCEYRQYCHVGDTAKQCRLGLFQDSDFAGDLEDSKSTSGGTLCIFGSHTFVPISWMCKKQTSVWHGSTESEIMFFGCWIAHGWFTCSSSVGHCNWGVAFDARWCKLQWSPACGKPGKRPKVTPTPKQKTTKHVDLSNIDQVPVYADSSHGESQLYIFEDNEAVIKMIIKGRSPTMRHVSRTHRVAFGLVVRQNQFRSKDPNQIWGHQKKQMADMLTKGSFTRDEWNHSFASTQQHHEFLEHLLAAVSFFQTESRVLWCRKGLKKVFHTIRQRWRQSQDQERWILCRIETCPLWDRILKKNEWFWIPGE